MRRTIGREDLWVNEYVIRYDGKPSHVIGVMEFRDDKVIRETIYVGEPWEPPAWRADPSPACRRLAHRCEAARPGHHGTPLRGRFRR